MTKAQRETVRQGLLDLGFRRVTGFAQPDRPDFYDHGDGVYTEVWQHTHDRTNIELRWDKKERDEKKANQNPTDVGRPASSHESQTER